MASEKILLDHGSGGKISHHLTEDVLLPVFGNPVLEPRPQRSDNRYYREGSAIAKRVQKLLDEKRPIQYPMEQRVKVMIKFVSSLPTFP